VVGELGVDGYMTGQDVLGRGYNTVGGCPGKFVGQEGGGRGGGGMSVSLWLQL